MQFDPEETGEARRQRQRDYHAFLDAQVQDRRKSRLLEVPATDSNDVEAARFPSLPLSGRLKHQASPPPYGVDPAAVGAARRGRDVGRVSRSLDDGSGAESRDRIGITSDREEYLNRLENRLEGEVQRRYLVERKVAVLGQKLENWVSESAATISSLGARDASVTEVREQTRNLGTELADLREWRNHVEANLSLAPKVQEMTQQQVKALEEEARTRIQADEARAARFGQAVQRVSGEVQSLSGRIAAKESGTLQRVAKLEAAFTEEAKGAREATRQLIEQVREVGSAASGADSKMTLLYQALRLVEKRQEEQQVAVAATRMQEELSRQEIQESLMATTSVKMGELRTSLMTELSSLMGETAKRVVESTNVPQAISALRGRVELAEGQLHSVADKSFRSLEEELNSVRSEIRRLEDRIDAGPVATNLNTLVSNTTVAQSQTQTQLTELQDALSAEITARRRNAMRLAEAQAATKEGNRESTVQMASGLRARCLELEELVARLTRDIRSAQEEMSSQAQSQLTAAQERNSRAVGKLEDSLAGVRGVMAQQEAELDKNWTKSTARSDELEALIVANKDFAREAEERARTALAAMETRRQAMGQQLTEKMEVAGSEETIRAEAIEHALREQGRVLREALEAGDRINRLRTDELRAEAGRLQDVANAQMEGMGQVTREMTRVRQNTDQVATDAKLLRERMHAEEIARIDDTDSLRRDLAIQKEASESRLRLWAEDRLQKERTAVEEALQRTQAHSGIVRALLDEAVKAVSKELNVLRVESRARDVALEEVLDERVSGLESRLTDIDSGAAKKCRLSDLSKETGVRIGEVERRVRQAERELKEKVEVQLALSSLVCTVADKESSQRLDQRASEELQLLTKHKETAIANDGNLWKELGKTNAVVANMQTDLGEAKAWQEGVDKVESRLLAPIEELRSLAEAAKSAAAAATTEASAASREAQAQARLAREASAEHIADPIAAADVDLASPRRDEVASDRATEGEKGAKASPNKNGTPKKVIDFSAMNDELEADSAPSTRRLISDAVDSDREVDDAYALRPKMAQIEEELQELKERLEEGIAEMDTLKQQLLLLLSAQAPQILQGRSSVAPNGSGMNNNDGIGGAVGQAVRSSGGTSVGSEGEKYIDPDNSQTGVDTPVNKRLQSDDSADGGARSESNSDSGEDGSGDESDSVQRSNGSNGSNRSATNSSPPLTPTSGASFTPALSPKSSSSNPSPPLSPQSALTDEGSARGNDNNRGDAESQSGKGDIPRNGTESDSSVDGKAQSGDGSDDEDGVASEYSASAVDERSASSSECVRRDSDSEGDYAGGGSTASNHEQRDDGQGGFTTARSALSSSNAEVTRSHEGNTDRGSSDSDRSTEQDDRETSATPKRSEASGSDESEAEESADEVLASSESEAGSPTRSRRSSSGDQAPTARRKL